MESGEEGDDWPISGGEVTEMVKQPFGGRCSGTEAAGLPWLHISASVFILVAEHWTSSSSSQENSSVRGSLPKALIQPFEASCERYCGTV